MPVTVRPTPAPLPTNLRSVSNGRGEKPWQPTVGYDKKGTALMKALCWNGKRDVRVEEVADPKIPQPATTRSSRSARRPSAARTCTCTTDSSPTLEKGDVLGHEFMGEIVETGADVKDRKVGDRVVVAFPIACGKCYSCRQELFSLCENTNPNAWLAEKLLGHSPAGIFGYSHMVGGFAGGQAEYARVPFADVGTIPIPDGLSDEQVLFLSDIFPTGYMAAENCNIRPGRHGGGDRWGCGPVGQFAIRSAFLLGAERGDRHRSRGHTFANGGGWSRGNDQL